jgi:hypothetical protein
VTARRTVLLLVLLQAAGCTVPGDAGSAPPTARAEFEQACEDVRADDGPGQGSADTHGVPQRSDGEIEIRQQGAEFVATRSVSIVNDFVGAAQSDVRLESFNGNVIACERDGGGYRMLVQLYGVGASEAEARRAVESLEVRHDDMLLADGLTLETRVESTANGLRHGASIHAGLPVAPDHAFDFRTANGATMAGAFHGRSAQLASANGFVILSGSWDAARLASENGNVSATGDYAELDASSSNGAVSAILLTARSLVARLSTSNGPAEVVLPAPTEAGFDLIAQAINGSASIDVEGTEPQGEQTPSAAHYRTPDYDSRAVQARVEVSTTNGDASIHQ